MGSRFNKAAVLILVLLTSTAALAQTEAADSSSRPTAALKPLPKADTLRLPDTARRRNNPRVATRRSAMVPGWGQITNKQAWKVPFVYAAVGIPAYLFFDNLGTYRELRDAYINRLDGNPANDDQIPAYLKDFTSSTLKLYRDEFRRNVDYSVLAFIIGWGLQVVDAAVFAHLKDFDVGDNLSMRIQPQFQPQLRSGGLSVVLSLKPSAKHTAVAAK